MRLAVAVLLTAALIASCEGAVPGPEPGVTTQLTVDGQSVIEGADFLARIESGSRNSTTDGFACYFSSFDDVTLNPLVRCGPAYPNLKGEQGPWETVSISAQQEPDGVRLSIGRRHGAGYRLLENEALSRPDGSPPPTLEQMRIPAVTGRVFETVWDSLDYDFHYCMASSGVFVFDARFTFDGNERVEWDAADQVWVGHDLEIPEGTNRIVYAIGDLAAGSFDLVIQDISGLGSAPAAVPSGSGDLASGGISVWLIALAAAAALALGMSARTAFGRNR